MRGVSAFVRRLPTVRLFPRAFRGLGDTEQVFQGAAEAVEGGLGHRPIALFSDLFVELRAVAVLEGKPFGYVFLYLGADGGADARVVDFDVRRLFRKVSGEAFRVLFGRAIQFEAFDFFFKEREAGRNLVGLSAAAFAAGGGGKIGAGAADPREDFVGAPALEGFRLGFIGT